MILREMRTDGETEGRYAFLDLAFDESKIKRLPGM